MIHVYFFDIPPRMLKVAFPRLKISNFSGGEYPQNPIQVSVSGACLLAPPNAKYVPPSLDLRTHTGWRQAVGTLRSVVKLNPGARKPHGKPIWPVEGLEPSATNRPFHAARPRRLQKTTIYTCKGKAQSRKSLTIQLQPEQTLRLKDRNPRKSSIFSVILLTSFFFFLLSHFSQILMSRVALPWQCPLLSF